MSPSPERHSLLRALPSVDKALNDPAFSDLLDSRSRESVTRQLRRTLDGLRRRLLEGDPPGDISVEGVARAVSGALDRRDSPLYQRVVNGTGIILHTGLGRAPFCIDAVNALAEAVKGYSRLAFDLDTGKRRPREEELRELLCELTGAESAQVCNNNAAGTMLVLNSVAAGKEVLCARGQLVEIGGAFRIPEVMEMSGARLREIGTTNRVHLRDYANNIDENVGAILKVHTSNYRIVGFHSEVAIDQLAKLGREQGLPVVDDLGSGAVYDTESLGLDDEPLVQESLAAGADLVCFSGDKLLGGPQAGIILGRKKYVDLIRDNPLMRALRVDKMTSIVLEQTVKVLLDEGSRRERHTTLRILSLHPDQIKATAQSLHDMLARRFGDRLALSVEPGRSEVGGGTTPTKDLPSWTVTLKAPGIPAGLLACKLRRCPIPVCGRVQKDAVVLDVRTFLQGDEQVVADALEKVLKV